MTDETVQTAAERLFDAEDSFTERKPDSVNNKEVRKTLVAFANSVPPDRPGLLLIGVSDSGDILGVSATEKHQKRVREICHDQCFPPINYSSQVLERDGKKVVAITVFRSQRGPHFAGHAYTRIGPENRHTSEETLAQLIAARTDVGAMLVQEVGNQITVKMVDKKLGEDGDAGGRAGSSHDCTLLEVTPHYIRLRDEKTKKEVLEDLRGVRLSRDLGKDRARIVIRPVARSA